MGRINLALRCVLCGMQGQDPNLLGDCECGASNWLNESPPPAPRRTALRLVPPLQRPAGPAPRPGGGTPPHPSAPRASDDFIDGSRVAPIIVDDIEGARINKLLGGIKRGAVVLIVGKAGAGKSTSIADLVAKTALHWGRPEAGRLRVPGCPIYWFDADQKDLSLVKQCFIQAGVDRIFSETSRMRLLRERKQPYTFEEALARLPQDARIVVFDSLETWATQNPHRQLQVLMALRTHPAWLKVMIGGANKAGQVSGVEALERADDVTVYAERTDAGEHVLRLTKRRWKPCPSAAARGEGEITPPAPAPPAAPPSPAPTPAAPAAAPDFTRAFIAVAAARWGVRELEGYKASLRAQGVPRDSVDGWLAAFREAREQLADGEADEPPPFIH